MNTLKSILLVFGGLVIGIPFSYAQKKVAELSLVYEYSVLSGNSQTPSGNAESSSYSIFIKGNLIRTDISSPLFSSSTIYDSKTRAAVILKEVSGQKLLIRLTPENWQEKNKPYEGVMFSNKPETKTIAGYKCSKATGKTRGGTEIVVYYTTDIVPDNKDYDYKFRNLEGLPLEYELTNGSLKIRYTLAKVNLNPVPASKFDLPKSGYREMTYEESKKLRQGS